VTSDRKSATNRANARASTGPKTAHGRVNSARNALRHGLSLPVCSVPAWSEEVETLAREIAGPDANAEIAELARHVAEAQIDLRRVRFARHQFLSHTLSDPYFEPQRERGKKVGFLFHLLEGKEPDIAMESVTTHLASTPQGPEKFAIILLEAKQLRTMDRYERRALSRRRFAIRALDEARRVAK
jgi:hypothetical protein